MRFLATLIPLVLSACAPTSYPDVIFELGLNLPTIQVPTPIKANALLTIKGEAAGSSGCVSFERLEVAERSASRLMLKVLGRRPGNPNQPCTANAPLFPFSYTDSPVDPRANPFTVVINGQTYSVTVEP